MFCQIPSFALRNESSLNWLNKVFGFSKGLQLGKPKTWQEQNTINKTTLGVFFLIFMKILIISAAMLKFQNGTKCCSCQVCSKTRSSEIIRFY